MESGYLAVTLYQLLGNITRHLDENALISNLRDVDLVQQFATHFVEHLVQGV
ncbi:hypothetical protein D3C87_2123080 [compost metagenome]